VRPNQAAESLRRLNMSAGGPGAARAVAITGLPLTGASSNFGRRSFDVPHRRATTSAPERIMSKMQLAVPCDRPLYAELCRDLVTACRSVREER
jgi:hypothetical protein